MSIIMLTSSMAITHKPTNISDKKPSNKLCSAVCINGAATGLNKSCSSFQPKALQTSDDQIIISTDQRRSGNFRPTLWDNSFVQSLCSEYKEERYLKRASELMAQVKTMLDDETTEVVRQLEFIDDLQRLGISYHFDDKINQILNHIYDDQGCKYYDPTDLHSTALRFRLLRQHGFRVPQEVFDCFKSDEDGGFRASLGDDIKGLLQLYEASFMLTEGENTLELARGFATKFLQEKNDDHVDQHLSLMVHSALELPFHWCIPRLNARWFINAYERRANMNPVVFELAKLDFNIVQATHQQELKHVSSWWKGTGLTEKLPFARDMLMECYFWTFFGPFEPKHKNCRIMLTKADSFITVIDDIFDVYGTIPELQLFNNVIQRWDIEAMDKLPDYMQICFLALNNFVDEMAYHVLKEQGVLIVPHLRKTWADLCEVYLKHAKWYSEGYTPKLEEYLGDACSNSSAFVLLSHAYFLVTNPIEKGAVQSLYNFHDIAIYSGLLLRLANDLGTSADEMERGDVSKSVQCYMKETGASVEEARAHVRFMIYEAWKKMNAGVLADQDSTTFGPEFVTSAVGIGRMALYVYYHHENRPGIQYPHMKDRYINFLFEPIP